MHIADYQYEPDEFTSKVLPDGESSSLGGVASGSDFKYQGIVLADATDSRGISQDPTKTVAVESWNRILKEPIPIPDDEFANLMDPSLIKQVDSKHDLEEFGTYLAGGGVSVDTNMIGKEISVRSKNHKFVRGTHTSRYERDGYS